MCQSMTPEILPSLESPRTVFTNKPFFVKMRLLMVGQTQLGYCQRPGVCRTQQIVQKPKVQRENLLLNLLYLGELNCVSSTPLGSRSFVHKIDRNELCLYVVPYDTAGFASSALYVHTRDIGTVCPGNAFLNAGSFWNVVRTP